VTVTYDYIPILLHERTEETLTHIFLHTFVHTRNVRVDIRESLIN
jgi:hypothetical protein